MKTQTKTLRGFVVSCTLALALACGLVPADAIAYATLTADQTTQTGDQTTEQLENSADAGEQLQADGADPGTVAAADVVQLGAVQPDQTEDATDQEPITSEVSDPTQLVVGEGLQLDESVSVVHVGAAVQTVDPLYFWQFPNAQAIVVDDDNAWFAAYEGVLYTADLKTLIAAPLALGAQVTIAPACEQIAEGAFRGIESLERIDVSGSVLDIFVSATDVSDTTEGYTAEYLHEAELSAFSRQTTQRAVVHLDVAVEDAAEAALVWRKVGFANVELPQAESDQGEEDADQPILPVEPDADTVDGSQDEGAGEGADGGADEATTDEVPRVLETEQELENTPQPPVRPQTVTGEYYILGTSVDNMPTADRVITSNDVMSYEAPIADGADVDETPEFSESDEEEQNSTANDVSDGNPIVETDGEVLPSVTEKTPIEEDDTASFEKGSSIERASEAISEVGMDSEEEPELELASAVRSASATVKAASARSRQYHTISWTEGTDGEFPTFYIYNYGYYVAANGKNMINWSSGFTDGVRYGEGGSAVVSYNPNVSDKYGVVQYGWLLDSGSLMFTTEYKYNDSWSVPTSNGRYVWQIVFEAAPGFKFNGWSGAHGQYVESDVYGYVANPDTKYAPIWEPLSYTFTYDPAGGTYAGKNPGEKYVVNFNTNSVGIPVPARPTRNGYKFLGYRYTGDFTTRLNNLESMYFNTGIVTECTFTDKYNHGNAVATAVWEPITYTGTFDTNGGAFSDGTTSSSLEYTIEDSDVACPEFPTRDGYLFAGWVISGDLLTNHPSLFFTVSGDDPLTEAIEQEYKVSYVAGAPVYMSTWTGTGWRGNYTCTAMWISWVGLQNNAPPSTSYRNNGYLYYYPSYGYSTTLRYGIMIEHEKGLLFSSDPDAVLVTPPSQQDGYIFKGWYTEWKYDFRADNPRGTQCLTSEGRLSSGAQMQSGSAWYTQWEGIEYTITLDPDGGAFDDGSRVAKKVTYMRGQTGDLIGDYTVGAAETGYTPTRSNWEFVGWRANSIPDTVTSSGVPNSLFIPYRNVYLEPIDYGNITFRAVWRAEITLDGNAPQWPRASTVTQSVKRVYYFTSYGFSFNYHGSGDSTFKTDRFFTKGNPMFAESQGHFTNPTCNDVGWIYSGYADGSASTVFGTDGDIRVSSVAGDTTWYAQWTPRTYTATLDPGPGTQGEPTKVDFFYGDTSLRGCGYSESAAYDDFMPLPQFEGWTFDGYYLAKDGDPYAVKYYGVHDVSHGFYGDSVGYPPHLLSINNPNDPLTGNCTLTAKWVRTITIDENGGQSATGVSGQQATIQVTYNEQLPTSISDVLPSTPTAAPIGATWDLVGLYGANSLTATQYYEGDGDRCYNRVVTTTTPSTLYARWQRTVTVDANGGEGGGSITILKGLTTPRLAEGIVWRDGYEVTSFMSQSTGGIKYFDQKGAPTAFCSSTTVPSTVYAQWSASESRIVFDANGGQGGPADYVGVTNEELTDTSLPTAIPIRDNYTFTGWYTEATDGDVVTVLPERYPIDGVTYYAHWELKPMASITFTTEAGGGGSLKAADGRTGSTIVESDILPDTGRPVAVSAIPETGYKFDGWYTIDDQFMSSQREDWAPATPRPGGWPTSTTYVARFALAGYSITYQCEVHGELSRGDEVACDHILSVEGLIGGYTLDDAKTGQAVVSQPTTPEYYEFTGWSGTDLEGSDTKTITIDEQHVGDKVYTAHVRAVDYPLALDADGGSWGSLGAEYAVTGDKAQRFYNVDTGRFQLPTPQKAGYTFDHWERAGQRVSATFMPGPNNYGSVTLVAVWSSAKAYTIEYMLGDDQGPEPGWFDGDGVWYNYAKGDTYTLPIPQRMGYDFLGWIEESDLPTSQWIASGTTPTPIVSITPDDEGDRKFRACWYAHEYTVKYDMAGGVWEDPQPTNPQTVLYDANLTMAKAPVRESYVFDHWEISTPEGGTAGAASRHDPGDVLTRANLIALVGGTSDGVSHTNVGRVTIMAVWTPRISFDVGMDADGVHMALKLSSSSNGNPFTTNDEENWGTATLHNRTDSRLKVTQVIPSPSASYDTLRNNALELFRTEENMKQASFRVRPSGYSVSLMTSVTFGIADDSGGAVLEDQYGNPYAFGWMMDSPTSQNQDSPGPDLTLFYQLDMGSLQPEQVNLSRAVDLQVSSVCFKVALVDA